MTQVHEQEVLNLMTQLTRKKDRATTEAVLATFIENDQPSMLLYVKPSKYEELAVALQEAIDAP